MQKILDEISFRKHKKYLTKTEITDILDDILDDIEQQYENNKDALINFLFNDVTYNLLDHNQVHFLMIALTRTGIQYDLVKTFLDNIGDRSLLTRLGVLRIKTKDGKEYYRHLHV